MVGVLAEKLVDSPKNSEIERVSTIAELKKVDVPIILDEAPEIFVKKLKPNIVVKGKEYEKNYNPEENVLKKFKGKIIFSSGETKSTSLK